MVGINILYSYHSIIKNQSENIAHTWSFVHTKLDPGVVDITKATPRYARSREVKVLIDVNAEDRV